MRTGKFPPQLPRKETDRPKVILLDLRSAEVYRDWHIKQALCFPAAKIQQDHVFSTLYRFKNQADKLIVIYHNDERHGVHQARIIFEKGFDNIYLLSGGSTVFWQEYPHLVEGMN